jgi:hypothetical protein
MTQENVLKTGDFLFKFAVPLLLFLLGLLSNASLAHLRELSGDIKELRKELRASIEEVRIEQAVMKEKLKSISGG